MHNFQSSLKKGKAGEALIAQLWPELVSMDGRKGDFTLGSDRVEIKSDSYGLNGSPNFFIERFSDAEKQTPGGPWQSLEHGANIFVYFYPADKIAFVFDTVILKNVLESILPNLKPVTIRNRGWVTIGYKVPRVELESIYTIKDFNEPDTGK